MKILVTVAVLLLTVGESNAKPPQAPPVRPLPPQAPPVRSEKTELRLYNGKIHQVPVDAPWDSTPNYPILNAPVAPAEPYCPPGQL